MLLSGDIFLRLDEFGSDGLARRLSQRGLRVMLEPMGVLVEYLAKERSSELIMLPTDRLRNGFSRLLMSVVRHRLYSRVRLLHPWIPMPDVSSMLRQSRRLMDRYPIGEAPIAVGSVLHNWRRRSCDGVVLVSPWGCGPALITESLLRHQRQIPMMFVYKDVRVDLGRFPSWEVSF